MHRPTAQTRGIIEAMVVNGVPQADIARAMQLDLKALRKCYREALDHATIIFCARVVRNLGKIARTGRGAAAVSACRYILGCRAGWKDTTKIEAEVEPGAGLSGLMLACGVDEKADVRQRIMDKLNAISANNDKIEAFHAHGEPDSCEAYKSDPGEEVDQGRKYSP